MRTTARSATTTGVVPQVPPADVQERPSGTVTGVSEPRIVPGPWRLLAWTSSTLASFESEMVLAVTREPSGIKPLRLNFTDPFASSTAMFPDPTVNVPKLAFLRATIWTSAPVHVPALQESKSEQRWPSSHGAPSGWFVWLQPPTGAHWS